MGKYDDIIDFPVPTSKNHPRMPVIQRAAQFSSFAALRGYDDAVAETGRLTDERLELEEDDLARLDEKLFVITDNIRLQPYIEIVYFCPDKRKSGGSYQNYSGNVKQIDEYSRKFLFADGTTINIDDIIDIHISKIYE